MLRLDDTYQGLLAELSPPLAAFGVGLPHKLGLTNNPEGGWEEFWILDPNRRPEQYATDRVAVRAEALEHWAAAHHCAVFFGLVFDRVADNQVENAPLLLDARRAFRDAWEERLIRAMADRRTARLAVARSLASLRHGTSLERAAFADRRLDPETYAVQTRDKLRWSCATPWCLLRSASTARAADLFERCYDLLGMAVQCTDDGVDAEDDLAIHGISVPALLGVPEGSLVRAAQVLTERARHLAVLGDFARLAQWLEKFHGFLENARPDGDARENERAGSALGARLVGALCSTPI